MTPEQLETLKFELKMKAATTLRNVANTLNPSHRHLFYGVAAQASIAAVSFYIKTNFDTPVQDGVYHDVLASILSNSRKDVEDMMKPKPVEPLITKKHMRLIKSDRI